MSVKKILFVALCLGTTSMVWAQQPADPKKDAKKAEKKERVNALARMEEEGQLIFDKHSVFGIKLNTDGYGLSYERGKFLTPRKTRLLMFELNEKKHPKEDKDAGSFDIFGNVKQFIFGKANNFFQVKGAYGYQYLIGGKGNKNGVSVSALWAGGVTVGLLKPYYVDVQDVTTQAYTRVKFEDVDDFSKYAYLGASGFTVGWGEVKVDPGLHAKAALRFDYGRFNELVSAIEAGVNLEYYTKGVLQMVHNDEKHLFFNAYVSILFGKRK